MKNPFYIKGYHGPQYFCDRVEETRRVVSAIENGRDVTLMAPRRYGKTGLIHNVFAALDKQVATIYLDIYSLRDLSEFTRQFAEAVVGALDDPLERAGKGLLTFFKSCRPTAVPTENGISWSFKVEPNQAQATLREVFDYLRSHDRECVIAIDEFQQVREFPEHGVEALLRGYIQNLENIHFIFAGSRRHLMAEMFAMPRGAFYKSTQLLELPTIPEATYFEFAARFFAEAGKDFKRELFHQLYLRFDGVTWYLQAILNRIWEMDEGLVDVKQIDMALEMLVDESMYVYEDLYRSQTTTAQLILSAVARSGLVKEISGREFLAANNLPSASTVRASASELVAADLLYRDVNGVYVYDKIFAAWLKR